MASRVLRVVACRFLPQAAAIISALIILPETKV
jgi:hypothetical protein